MDTIEGTIESIVFYNPESGYTVCRFQPTGEELWTLVGTFPPLSPGEVIKVKGQWELNPRFGKQFKADNYIPVLPSSIKGIEKFLSSGMIKGIGPVLAQRIVNCFGKDTLSVLSKRPGRLREVEGLGAVKMKEIKKSWAEHEDIRGLIMFLQEHNISTGLATRIYRQYGKESFQILKTNPYQASHDIWGVGFRTADQMALKLGMSPTSPERIKAFISYALEKDNEHGHVFSKQSDLLQNAVLELGAKEEKVKEALEALIAKNQIAVEPVADDTAVYLPFFYHAQTEVAQGIAKLSAVPFKTPQFDIEKAISGMESLGEIRFSPKQKKAISECFAKKMLVITGGPGTGKTTIIRAVVDIFRKWGRQVLLAAPTGRAAKRLADASGCEAKTIHRTLEFNPKLGSFRRNETRPLTGDALIVDEFSMVDLPLMYHMLKAMPPWMRLILVGDKDQLPSVGPGNLLQDIIASGRVEVVELDEIFRQAHGSLIVSNAHRINQGKSLVHPKKGDKESDFYFLSAESEDIAFKKIMALCEERIPQRFGLDPRSPQIQVISPMYRGLVGVDNLNLELQKRLNPQPEGLKLGNREIRVRDKVMQIRNNYNKEVFNGDIGIVKEIDRPQFRISIDFDGRITSYQREEMNEIVLAYAVSVHKSQGSEYQSVVIPLLTQHFIMLQRNLFYTALTRAKKLSCVVGSYKALYIAIKNDKPIKRNCRLKNRLMEIAPQSGAKSESGGPQED